MRTIFDPCPCVAPLALATVLVLGSAARDERVQGVLAALGEGDASAAARELIALRRGCDELFDVLIAGPAAGLDGGGVGAWSVAQSRALLLAITAHPAADVRRLVDERARTAASGAERRALLDLLAIVGSGADLVVLVRASAPAWTAAEPADDADGRALESALAAILARDRRAFAGLDGHLRDAELGQLPHLLRGIGASGERRGLVTLANWLGTERALDALVLGEIARLASAHPPPFDDYVARSVRRHLDAGDAAVRGAAAEALGALGDDESAPEILDLLASETLGVRASALAALRRLSGHAYPSDPARWRLWLESETAWWDERAPAAFDGLASGEPARVAAALGEMCALRLRRHELAERVVPLLASSETSVRALACHALAQLGSIVALDGLVEVLRDSEPAVRDASYGALETITGLRLPREPEAWRDALAEHEDSWSSR